MLYRKLLHNHETRYTKGEKKKKLKIKYLSEKMNYKSEKKLTNILYHIHQKPFLQFLLMTRQNQEAFLQILLENVLSLKNLAFYKLKHALIIDKG